MKRTIGAILFGLLFPLLTLGQDRPLKHPETDKDEPVVRCATDKYNERLLEENPENREVRKRIQQHALEYMQKSSAARQQNIVTIPVVFHVVYENSTENISATQVQSQLDVLNEDFRRLNSDTTDTRSQFVSDATDTEIQFCMAQRDPNGNATNGITRTQTNVSSFSTNNDVKHNGTGGKDAWPRDDYLNIWICDLGGGLLGYAQFPGSGSADEDGVVLNYTNTGTTGTAQAPYDLGRTGTHEVGHWLDLFHTFQNGCSGTSSSTCNTGGDRCCDTPPVQSANYGCPNNPNSCSETPTDRVDQWENYMDYTDDACMNMFSNDQSTRMNALFSPGGFREPLLNSNGCVPPANWDVAITEVLAPTGNLCNSVADPKVVLKNNGANTLNSVDIGFDVDGANNQTYAWSGSLASGNADTVTLPSINPSTGPHTFNAYTEPNTLNGSNSDQNTSNDSASASFTVVNGKEMTFSITPDCWGGDVSWVVLDGSGNVVENGSLSQDGTQGQTFDFTYCLPVGCYDFRVYDSYGDGMYGSQYNSCSADGDFWATNVVGDTLFQMSTPNAAYGDSTTHNFCLNNDVVIYNVDSVNVSCNGANDGSILVQATGAPNMDYSIDNGNTWDPDSLFTGLGPGTYEVIAKDVNSSLADTITVTLTEPASLNLSGVNTTHPTCGNNNGVIDISAQGGTKPYRFSIDGGSNFASDSVFSNLAPGTFSIVVKDTNDCQVSTSVTLNDLSGPVISGVSQTSPSCGSQDGSLTVNTSGGSGTLSFSIDSGSTYQTNNTFNNLGTGVYDIVVTDTNGCMDMTTDTLNNPSSPVIDSVSITDETCGQGDGKLEVHSSGGTTPYQFSIDGGSNYQSGSIFGNLSAGTYDVKVKDANGCESVITQATISDLAGPQIDFVDAVPTDCGESNGSLTVNASGGNGQLTYSIDNGNTFSSNNYFSGLPADTYDVVVKDGNGCTDVLTMDLDSTGVPNAYAYSNKDTAYIDQGGTVDFYGTSSSGSNHYWDFGDGNNASGGSVTHSYTTPGTYTVVLSVDMNSCTDQDTLTIVVLETTSIEKGSEEGSHSVEIFPNPSRNQVNVSFRYEVDQEKVRIQMLTSRGKVLDEKDYESLKYGKVTFDLFNRAEGVYFLRIQSDGGVINKRFIVL